MESQSPGREEGKAEAGPARRGRGGRGGEGGPGERRGGNSVEGSNGPDAESLANAGAPAMRGLAGPQAQGLGGRGFGGPELGFYMMEGADKVWKVGYNLQTGLLTGRAEDAPPNIDPLSTRRFLLRLHTAHGYPAQLNARWFWAIAVDLMFVSMVGWGFTGLLMWWQMKNVRFVGGIVLAVGIASSLIVAFAMHSMMISGEGR